MNLLEASRSLSKKIVDLSETESREQVMRSIQPIEDALDNLLTRFIHLNRIVEYFCAESLIDFDSVEYSFKSACKKLEPVRKALESDPVEALKRNRWANCHESLKAVIKDLEQELRSTWMGFIGEMSHDIANLEPFIELGDGARGIKEIKSKQGRLTAYGKSLPADEIESCICTVKALSLEIGKQVDALDLGDLPDEVELFIKRVKSFNGATLADLDLEVFEWLKSKDMLKNFKVN